MEHVQKTVGSSPAAWAVFEGAQSLEQRRQFEQRMRELGITCQRTVLPGMQNLYLYRCAKS